MTLHTAHNSDKQNEDDQHDDARVRLTLFIYKLWILSVIGGTMNRVIFPSATADTFLCRPMRLKILNQNPKSKGS